MPWDQYTKDAEVGTGGDIPLVPEDLYDAMVQDVTEPRESTYEGKAQQRFIVKWEITSGDVPEGTTLWQYITLPDGYLQDGILGEKSNLYKTMKALGIDMEGRFRVDPPSWQGMEARIMVETRVTAEGKERSVISSVKAKPQRQQKRETVAAGATKDRSKADDWEDE